MYMTETEVTNAQIEYYSNTAMPITKLIEIEISDWKNSKERQLMKQGDQYYKGDQDISERERKSIGEDGRLQKVKNLADNKLIHTFLRKLVDQKTGYLLSKPMSIQTDQEEYEKILNDYFDKAMLRKIKNLGKEAIVKGRAWLHIFYDESGNLSFSKIPSEEIIPLWKDQHHTILDAVIRVYEVEAYEGRNKKTITKVEFWDTTGVKKYIYDTKLIPDVEAGDQSSHFTITQDGTEQPVNWSKVPFICFKYNEEEIPLIKYVKSLIDDYDKQKSDNANNLEDLPNSIYVVKGHSGTEGGEFRKNISQYRVVFTEGDGDVDSINIEFNTEAYKEHMDRNRKDIYEMGRGVDTQQKEIGNSPSGVALKFLYADLDMDVNILESEFQAALEELLWFIDVHIANTTDQDFSNEPVDFIFNRDIIINETEAITNTKDSVGILSEKTVVANHPWTTDVNEEMDRIQEEKDKETERYDEYQRAFSRQIVGDKHATT